MEADHVDLDDDKPGERGRIWIAGRPGLADRPALPAGHPETWGMITHGTILDGVLYPFPVFGLRLHTAGRVSGPGVEI